MENEIAKKHLEVTKAFAGIIFESMMKDFAEVEVVTKYQFEKMFKNLESCWPHIESLHELVIKNYKHHYVKDPRRHDYLTRLVFSRVMVKIPNHDNYPRCLLKGVKENIEHIYKNDFDIVNSLSQKVFELIETEVDEEVVDKLDHDILIEQFANQIFLSLMLKFVNFNFRRADFFRIFFVTYDYKLTDLEFCDIFEALFGNIIKKYEENRYQLVVIYGDEFIDKIGCVVSTYKRYKEGIILINTPIMAKKKL